MDIHAVVPVKALDRAKSRLSGHLDAAERRALVLDMLGHVLCSLLARRGVELAEVWVVSADPAVLALAERLGARGMPDQTSDLNAALGQARDTLGAAGAAAMLVVPADVPLISAADIVALAAMIRDGAGVVLATDRAGSGTNALGLRLPSELPFLFGEQSAALHQAAAQRGGLRLARYASPTISLDVDDPKSLARYGAHAAPCLH